MNGTVTDLNLPATPQQAAAAKLESLSASPDWRGKLLSGHGPTVKEFHDLMAAKDGGDQLDAVVAGTAKPPDIELVSQETGGISVAKQMRSAADLRERGVSDAAIKQLLKNDQVSEAEYRNVKSLRADLLADKDFTSALLSGNREALRDLLHANIVIVGGYRDEKAA